MNCNLKKRINNICLNDINYDMFSLSYGNECEYLKKILIVRDE